MTHSKLFLAAACAAALSFGASAANWTITDGVASVTADCELTEADQRTVKTRKVLKTVIVLMVTACLALLGYVFYGLYQLLN